MPIPYEREQIRQATLELIARNGLRSCYIRPLVFRGYGTMGLFPLEAPRRRRDRRLGVGRLPRRGGQAQRHPRQGLLVAADQPRLADPARQGRRPVPQQRAREDRDAQGRLRRGDPARRPRPRLRGLGREHLRRARRRHLHAAADRVDPRRHQPQVRAIQIARDLGIEVVERDIARAELYLADEVFLTGTAAELVPVREIDDHAIGDGQARARSRAPSRRPSTTRCTDANERYREWLDPVPVRRRRRARVSAAVELYDATLRDGMGGGGMCADRAGEAARRAPARRARRAPDRGRLPGFEPQGAGAVRAARGGEPRDAARSSPSA